VLRLTLPAPDTIETTLGGQRPAATTSPGLMEPFLVESGPHRRAEFEIKQRTRSASRCAQRTRRMTN
jgi:hypothetical protein